MILDQNHNTLAEIKQLAAGLPIEGAYSLPFAFEINPPGITKANTLVSLLTTMGLDDLPVYIVGDGENDLSLFMKSVMSFAPSSAHPAVLTAADHIIPREKNGLLRPILELMAEIV
jgi:hydroxymethylpyrimidine pyrophosphatase-like HAD family hydrolase